MRRKDKETSVFDKYHAELKKLLSQKTNIKGDPEAQVVPLVRDLLQGVEKTVRVEHEVRIEGGRIDLAVKKEELLVGFVEVKAPNKPLPPYGRGYDRHDKEQWERFKGLPNLLYTNGLEFALFRLGEKKGEARLPEESEKLKTLLTDFFNWQPIIPQNPKELAKYLAPIARSLREDVLRALDEERKQQSQDLGEEIDQPFNRLKEEWSRVFFRTNDAHTLDDKEFADAYAQLLVYGFLLGQMERPKQGPSSLEEVLDALQGEYGVLMDTLFASNHPRLLRSIRSSYDLLRRVIAAVDPEVLKSSSKEEKDPWLYFYEDFLAEYDPKLRRDMGVYYTPTPVVRAMVALTDHLLKVKLKKERGLADETVTILDPAAGTGTFLLGVLEKVAESVNERGTAIQAGQVTSLAERMYAFEIMIGPYAVAQLRLSRAIKAYGGRIPKGGLRIYLADTLESPLTPKPLEETFFLERLSIERKKAARVKTEEPILVCIGNPPYDRVQAKSEEQRRIKGGWILEPRGENGPTLLDDFIEPLKQLGYGVHAKNLYNLYVYFWRWALWKVFESEKTLGKGVIAFITPRSFLSGPGFAGMRAYMRNLLDEIYILDLGGEGRLRGSNKDENIFNIRTPVCITLALKYRAEGGPKGARVFYYQVPPGGREKKMKLLEEVAREPHSLLVKFHQIHGGPYSPFVPTPHGGYSQWPKITDLFPWQHSGVEFKRTWPIGPTVDVLKDRWNKLLQARPQDKPSLFREERDRKVSKPYKSIFQPRKKLPPISSLQQGTSPEDYCRYAYRPLDRAWAIVDGRVCSLPRPVLWHIQGDKQIYLASRLTAPLERGPALIASVHVPDRHIFSGGAKDIIPLYRDKGGSKPNITEGLLGKLKETYGMEVSPEDFLAYVYAVLAHPYFTRKFVKNLSSPPVRVPITKDPHLFTEAVRLGKCLLCCHTFGERFCERKEECLQGEAKVDGRLDGPPNDYDYDEGNSALKVGTIKVHPVRKAVWEYEVGGYRVLKRWLDFRIKGPSKPSSALDEIQLKTWDGLIDELQELIWAIECSLGIHEKQRDLLDAILSGEVFSEEELPKPSPGERKPPKEAPEDVEEFEPQSSQPMLLAP